MLERYVTPDRLDRFVVPLDWEKLEPQWFVPDLVELSLPEIFDPPVFR
ncbi:hypothetical protein [Streptomyces sp. NPDC048644]